MPPGWRKQYGIIHDVGSALGATVQDAQKPAPRKTGHQCPTEQQQHMQQPPLLQEGPAGFKPLLNHKFSSNSSVSA